MQRLKAGPQWIGQHRLFDGAIGTSLYERGFFINKPFEELNISASADVLSLHKEYVKAGAQVLTTNTFAATRPQLRASDLEKDIVAIISNAIHLANEARKDASHPVWVGFSMGPLGDLLEPLGSVGLEEAKTEFAHSAKLACEYAQKSGENFDLYILETFSNLNELRAAVDGIRSVDQERFVLASLTVRSQETEKIQRFAALFGRDEKVDYLGLNCSEGPSDTLVSLKKLVPLVKKPIVVQPNAGTPRHVNGRYFYLSTPDYLAKFAKRFLEAGAAAVGGCCGTGPEHIEAMSSSVKMIQAQKEGAEAGYASHAPHATIDIGASVVSAVEHKTNPSQSRVLRAIQSGEKVLSVEILPPLGTNLDKFLSHIDRLILEGIKFVNVPDGARASTRLNSMHLAAHLESKYTGKISVIPHYTTRDRNLIALQSDLLGAYVNGVRDVLLVTGDPPKLGNNREATAVYDIDSIGLTYLVKCLNENRTPNGESLKQGTAYGTGVATNPTAIDFDLELKRWGYKVESGAQFAITQPIFDVEKFFRWQDKLGASYKPHLVGIWPFVSFRNAEFMSQEVPGVSVPQHVLRRMERFVDDLDGAKKEGVLIAQEIMEALKHRVEGYCVSAPLGMLEPVLQSMKGAGVLNNPSLEKHS